LLSKEEKRSLPFTVRYGGEDRRIVMVADPYNSRIKLKSFEGDPASAAVTLLKAARSFGFGKAIAYVRPKDKATFSGFMQEGEIPGYFGGEDAICLVSYTSKGRSIPRDQKKAEQITKLAQKKAASNKSVNTSYVLRVATADDSAALASFFGAIFKDSYPTPVSEPAYLREAISSNTVFWLVEDKQAIIGAASLETDPAHKNAEVTDCAVLPAYRGQGLLAILVNQLEGEGRRRGLTCLYSLSRALLPGINIVLSASGYRWYGRLINNCRICGGFEDMNIWQKFINE
jgi:putative beta-lysine N-acetyltransferase